MDGADVYSLRSGTKVDVTCSTHNEPTWACLTNGQIRYCLHEKVDAGTLTMCVNV